MAYYKGFDVRGISMADGSVVGAHDASVLRAGPNDSRLLNPDGYTRFWNPTEFTSTDTLFGFTKGKLAGPAFPNSTINPYKYFADNLGPDDSVQGLDPGNRGVFTDGSTNSRTYQIQFKQGLKTPFDFNYAIDASWSAPDPAYAPDFPVQAYFPSANVQEPFYFQAKDAGSTAYWASTSISGGEFKFDLDVFDRQGNVNPSGVPGGNFVDLA